MKSLKHNCHKNMKRLNLIAIALTFMLIFSACQREEVPVSGNEENIPKEIEALSADMLVLGDNLMHMPVVNDGKQPDGTYDYSAIFSQLRNDISNADIAVIGQETVLGGEELGLSGYPLFNSPYGVGITLEKEGFDVVLHASNHILDKGAKGIENTLLFWELYPRITVLGINKSQEQQDRVRIIKKNGMTFALLNYTYSTNGIPLPAGKEYMVNMLNAEKIERDIKSVRDEVDFVVVFPHWGNEYQMTASNEQQTLALKMCEWGADAIIGSHPHVIEPCNLIEGENGNKAVVFYSLGNFVSRQKETKNLLGGMASLEFTKKGEEKSVKAKFTPIVTQYDLNSSHFTVYKLKDYNDNLAQLHGISLYDGVLTTEKFRKIYESILPYSSDGIEFDA